MKTFGAIRSKWRPLDTLGGRRQLEVGSDERAGRKWMTARIQSPCLTSRFLVLSFFSFLSALIAANGLCVERSFAASPVFMRYSLKPLDVTHAPEDEKITAAGQLGGPLYPTFTMPNNAKHEEINLSFAKAIEKWNRHEYREATSLFRKHAEDYPDSPWAAEAKLHVGCDATYNGRYAEAEDNFVSIIEANKNSTTKGAKALVNKAKLRLGVLKMMNGDFDSAREYFAQLYSESSDWRDKTYASTWIRELSLFNAERNALLNCGVLALAKLLEKEGKLEEARLVSAILPHCPKGFSIKDLKAQAESFGYPLSAIRVSQADLETLPLPAIAHISGRSPGETGHYWVIEKLNEEGLTIFDPQGGQRFVQTKEEFSKQWNGIVLVFSKTSDLPGARLSLEETGSLYGGCCGVPRPPNNTGAPEPSNDPSGGGGGDSGGKNCGGPSPNQPNSGGNGPGDSHGAPSWQVNMVNMNLFVTDTPIWYKNPVGPPVEITLSYNSQSAIVRNEPFGNKWQFNYATYLVVNSADQVTIFMPDGKSDVYTPDGSGGYIPPLKVHNTLTKVGENHFELRFPDDTVYIYNIPAGTSSQQPFLTEIRDVQGKSLFFGYNSDVFLTTITDASGRMTRIYYNRQGFVSRVKDPFGRIASFEYDRTGNLIKIIDMGKYWTSFSYDTNVFLTGITRPTGTWSFYIEPPDGIPNGSSDYPPPGGKMWEDYRITVTDPMGGKREYAYGGDNIVSWYVSPKDYIPYVDSTNNNWASRVPMTKYKFIIVQQVGRIANITYPDGYMALYTYDPNTGEVLDFRDRNFRSTTYTYNSMGKVVSITYPSGLVKRMTYAANGVDLTGIEDGFGTEKRTYDNAHKLTSITDRTGNTTFYGYNQHGRMLFATDPLGNTTTYTYDTADRLVQVTKGTTVLWSFSYDEMGRLAAETDAAGLTRGFSYNDLDNVVEVSYPDGTSEIKTYAPCCPHLVASETDRAGRTTQYSYNALNRLAEISYPNGATERYGYDANMNRTSVTDPNGNTTTFAYDVLNLLTSRTDPTGKVTSYSYDVNGNRTSSTDALGNITSYSYDPMNRLLKVTDPTSSVTNYTRDLRGLVTLRTDPIKYNTSFAYDAEGRMTSKTDRNGATLTYSYTATGMLATTTYPNGSQVSITYDELGRITSMNDPLGTSSYTYDAAGRITSFTDTNGFVSSYSYDQMGNMTSLTYPDGSTVTYEYDALNRMRKVTDWENDTASYTYDMAGNLAVFTQFNGIITTYSYDAGNRLLGMGSIVSSYEFTLDANGNRIRSTQSEPLAATPPGAEITYGYNYGFDYRKNRLLSAGSTSYTYDNEGQLASAGGISYTFDYNHRLVGIGSNTRFEYDGGGNRVSATRNGAATRYVYDPRGRLLAEADESNNIMRKYIYGKELLAVATPSAKYCYHFNGIGSTTALTDMNQSIANSYTYDPFGTVLSEQETIQQPFKFVGEYGVMAEPDGLYYMRARYYDPSVGRFISEDPLGVDGGDVNLYVYVQNNPINGIDPHGLTPIGCAVTLWKAIETCGLDYKDAWDRALRRQDWCERAWYYCNAVDDPPNPSPSKCACESLIPATSASAARISCLSSTESSNFINHNIKCANAMVNLVSCIFK